MAYTCSNRDFWRWFCTIIRRLHILIKNVSFFSSTDVGSYRICDMWVEKEYMNELRSQWTRRVLRIKWLKNSKIKRILLEPILYRVGITKRLKGLKIKKGKKEEAKYEGPIFNEIERQKVPNRNKKGVYIYFSSLPPITLSLTFSIPITNQAHTSSAIGAPLQASSSSSSSSPTTDPWPDLNSAIVVSDNDIGALGSPKFATLYCNSPSSSIFIEKALKFLYIFNLLC